MSQRHCWSSTSNFLLFARHGVPKVTQDCYYIINATESIPKQVMLKNAKNQMTKEIPPKKKEVYFRALSEFFGPFHKVVGPKIR